MNFLDKHFLENPTQAIEQLVSAMKQTGQKTSFNAIRAYLYPIYLGIDAQKGTNYAENFALATNMPKEECEELRYKWSEKTEKDEKRRDALAKDPQWCGKEIGEWAICIQEQNPNELGVPDDDARVVWAKREKLRSTDFFKAKFLYIPGKKFGFICKAEDFNFDTYKFTGQLRVLF